jgi:hypothetical protein
MQPIRVTLDGIEPFVALSLQNARLAEVALPENLGATTVVLEPGAYSARFKTSLWEQEQTFVVLAGEPALKVSPLAMPSSLVRSAAPLRRTDGCLDSDGEIAQELSARKTAQIPGLKAEGSLFVMLRKRAEPDGDALAVRQWGDALWEGIELLDTDGRPCSDLSLAAFSQLPSGIACAHVALPEGAYRLCFPAPGNRIVVSQFLFVARGHQTRVFILDRSSRSNPPIQWDKARFSVQFAPCGSVFDPASSELLAAEELMNILEVNGYPNPNAEWMEKVVSSESPALDLAFCLARMDPWRGRFGAPQPLIERLLERLSAVPDAMLLGLASGVTIRQGALIGLRDLPMTARAWDVALWAETKGILEIPAGSTPARIASSVVRAGPWLRFTGEQAELGPPSQQVAEMPSSIGGFDFSSLDLESVVRTLRDHVRQDPTVRISYGSPLFSLVERRLLDLLCPEADSIVYRIMRNSPQHPLHKYGEPTGDDPPSGEAPTPEFPTRKQLAMTLRLPSTALVELAINAIAKLSGPLLPTPEQLEAFIVEEAAQNGGILEPLQILANKNTPLVHAAEGIPLKCLALVYLLYRGGRDGESYTVNDLAGLLNRLGFIIGGSDRKVEPEDIDSELSEAEGFLSKFHNFETVESAPPEGGLWEDLQVKFADPVDYRPGSLCVVTRRPGNHPRSPVAEQWWNDHPFSYSLSLEMAGDPPRWRVTERQFTAGQSRSLTSTNTESPQDVLRRYLETMRSSEDMAFEDLRSRLEERK